jgi:P-type E1-E2 ATPase
MAIGDGSNDVAMIHTANIGVGLYGLEGSEASSSSDYALCEFKDVRRLMFHHGMHVAYKMTKFIEFSLFKTSIYAIMPLFLSFYDGYSG